ncbi:hypothetical protein [Halomonas sp. BMC6]|uniref:hypothetical protein n=1 Tax=Halomonas sp. BMC6 TaxID=3073244 RepID=UPI0030D4115C
MKHCKKCGEEKPLDGFYKHPQTADGFDSACKECRKVRVRENYRKNIDHYREYEKKRGMLPHRVAMRERYQSTPEGKAAIQRGTKKYRDQNKIKMQGHNRVSKALIDGRLERQTACQECGATDLRLHAHHDDYLKQLDVRWLCPPCHKSWHDENGEAANSDHEPLPQFHMRFSLANETKRNSP